MITRVQTANVSHDNGTDNNDTAPVIDKTIESSWVFENVPIGLIILEVKNTSYILAEANAYFEKSFKITESEYKNAPLEALTSLPIATAIIEQANMVRKSGKLASFEWIDDSVAKDRCFSCQLVPRQDKYGNVHQILGSITDRTTEKRAERNLLHNALHDSLTELPNRVLFQEHIEDALAALEEDSEQHCAVLIANVDRFQSINETLGHIAGDEFLIAFAARMKRSLRAKDKLARLNGDEFAFLIPGIETLEDVQFISDRIHQSLTEPFQLGRSEFYSSISIGIATTLSSLPYPEELIRDADFAMHRAKATGRAKTEIYHRSTHDQARSAFLLEIELRKAVDHGQLELFYQPIMNLASGKLTAFEALCRWNHPEKGLVPPDQFIPIAEETGIIVDLGSWALEEACRQVKQWRDTEPAAANLGVTVNVSNAQFRRTNVARDTAAALESSGLSGDALRLELTETVIMENPQEAVKNLNEIKELNVGLALDDFGTGYSSLGSLQNFPLDVIKIDRSFVSDIQSNDSNFKIVEIITQLSRTLGFDVVAEGIEEIEHIRLLQKLGCMYGQGYYISKPMPMAQATKFIRRPRAI